MLERNAAERIHRVEEATTNWYLVEGGATVTIVDAGFPRSWASLERALGEVGRSLGDIEAVVLTHGHFDHVGFARRARQDLGVALLVHEHEVGVAAHPWRYEHERSRLPYLRNGAFLKILGQMISMGALNTRGIESARTYRAGERLDVPGRPQAIFTPGHTNGHCSLFFPDRGALIAGDALVMLDPYTGRHGPCIVAGAATADSQQALSSLEALAELDADTVLTGHGPPWHGSTREAIERARAAGAA